MNKAYRYEIELNRTLKTVKDDNATCERVIRAQLETVAEDSKGDVARILGATIDGVYGTMPPHWKITCNVLARQLEWAIRLEESEVSDGIQTPLALGAVSALEGIACALKMASDDYKTFRKKLRQCER